MNANPRNTRLTLLATLAGTMMLAGTAHAADGKGGRPSTVRGGGDAIPQVQDGGRYGGYDGDRCGTPSDTGRKYDRAVADRDHTGPASDARASDSQARTADRNNAGPSEAEMFEAMLRDLADPFGFGSEEADRTDTKADDDSTWPSCDPMDRDADGDVDFDDFKILAAAFGTDEGDLDGDRIVTGADLGLMLVRLSGPTVTATD